MQPYKANTYLVKWRDRSQDADAFVIDGGEPSPQAGGGHRAGEDASLN